MGVKIRNPKLYCLLLPFTFLLVAGDGQPWKVYERCRQGCDAQQGSNLQDQYCRWTCNLQYYGERGESRNPYFFDSLQWFESKSVTREGRIRVLERFGEASELLRCMDNYRLLVLEVNSSSFVPPHHADAETIFFIVEGRGAVSLLWKNERRTHMLNEGDAIRVPAGATLYLVSSDASQRLYILGLIQPLNTLGEFQDFVGVGGHSYYTSFGNGILQAAFNTPRGKLERLFGQEDKGHAIMKASKQQIEALSHESEGGRKHKWSPINLPNQTPLFSGEFGRYFEASPNDHDQLKDLDIAVGFTNISRGGMILPYYNTRSTMVAFVAGGTGYYEMATPHVPAEGDHLRYKKEGDPLTQGNLLVVPAGHPVTFMASNLSGLQLVSFEIKGAFNQKHFLAGKKNIWNVVEAAAKELSFGMQRRRWTRYWRCKMNPTS